MATTEQKPNQSASNFNPQTQTWVNQLVTENQRGLLPTSNNQIAIVPSQSQSQLQSKQFNPQSQNIVNQLVNESQRGLLPTPNNQITVVPSQTQTHASQPQQFNQPQILPQ